MDAVKQELKQYFIDRRWVIAVAVFCSVLWGSAFPVLKVSYIELGMSPDDLAGKVVLAGMRFFLSAIMLFILALLTGRKLKVSRGVLLQLLVLGILQTSLQYFFFYNGLAHTSGMKGAVLSSSGTFFVVMLAPFFYANDRLDWRKTLGLITGLIGILLVNTEKELSLTFSLQGEGFLIFSGLASALGTFLAKRLSDAVHPFVLTGWQMFLGSVLLSLTGITALQPGAMSFTLKAWLLLIYSSFLSAAAFSLWYALLKYNKAGEISIYKFMVPVSGAILSALFIPGEGLTVQMLGALLFVSLGIAAVNYPRA